MPAHRVHGSLKARHINPSPRPLCAAALLVGSALKKMLTHRPGVAPPWRAASPEGGQHCRSRGRVLTFPGSANGGVRPSCGSRTWLGQRAAAVAELADALGSGPSDRKIVEVRLLSAALSPSYALPDDPVPRIPPGTGLVALAVRGDRRGRRAANVTLLRAEPHSDRAVTHSIRS